MGSNRIVQILAYQNQVAALEEKLKPFIKEDPANPAVIELRLDLAYMRGKLDAHLEVLEQIS